MLLTDPVLQELNRRPVAEGRMLPFSVVKRFDVFKGGRLDLGVCGVANAMHSLVLEAVEPTLRRRVIPAVPLSAHRAGHAVFLEPVLKCLAGVLTAPVGVMQQARCRSPAEPGHGQGIGHDIRRHARLQRPADHFAVEQVEHDSQVEPAFIRPQVGDIRRPDLIGRRRREVSGQQVSARVKVVVA